MNRPQNPIEMYTKVSNSKKAALFALDYSTSMTAVAAAVVEGYEQCRQEWTKRIPDALFIPAGFHNEFFFLTEHPVPAVELPELTEEKYLKKLKGGSRLLDVFETGLHLVIDGKVDAIFIMTDGWQRKSLSNYHNIATKILPEARKRGCVIRFLIYYNPKYEKQLWEFIRMSGLRENEYIIFRHGEVQDRVDQVMVGLRNEVLKIHEKD